VSDGQDSQGPPGFDYEALLEVFHAESRERLDRMEEVALVLDRRPDDLDLLHELFRGLHTLKGDGASLGFTTLAALAHRAEDLLERVRAGSGRWDGPTSNMVLRVVDLLRGLLSLPKGATSPEIDELEGEIDALTAIASAASPSAGNAGGTAATEGNESSAPTTLRVPIATMDRLLDNVGEILVARETLRSLLRELPAALAQGAVEVLEAGEELHRDLQSLVMSARLVPVAPLLQSLRRVLRNAESRGGKLVDLEVSDHGTEVDARLVECLRAPLGHLVRNAVDHGIEEPALRVRLAKPLRGRVRLDTAVEAASLVVRVADDGAGIDRERVVQRARPPGMSVPAEPSPRQLLRLLTAPGVSTAAEVSDLSGRGVGLDVVARAVELVRGTMEVDSERGVGTTFTLRLPLAVSILDGFHLRVGGEDYILPLEHVRECHPAPALPSAEPRGTLDLRGGLLPYIRLRTTLGVSGSASGRESLLVVESAERRYGLVVDEMVGACQCVVKALGGLLRGVPGIFGSTLLGTGRVALILDLPALIAGARDAKAEIA
jgi:two-component system chemotaxis sensor kinase CheA